MEEKVIYKSKKGYNPLQQKLSSQVKRIEELLKSGDIPWRRVKSAYMMSELAISQVNIDIKAIYPFKQYIRLVQLIFNQLLQFVEDELEDDISTRIQSKLIGTKNTNTNPYNTNPNKRKNNKTAPNNQNNESNEKDFNQQTNFPNSSQSQSNKQESDILQRYKFTNQSLVEIELKKVINSFDLAKTSLIEELIKNQNKTKNNQILSENFKTQLNDILGSWKQEISEKYKELNKYVEDNKSYYTEQIKKKDAEIERLMYGNNRKYERVNCAAQTSNDFRENDKKIIDKEQQFNMQKQRFLRVTKGYEKEIMELKKYNKTLRTSSHLKLDQYEKSIIDLNKQIKYIKRQFKQYFQGNRETQEIFFNIYQKHQKAKTPFIPKSQIHQVYEKLKSKDRKESLIISMLIDEQKQKQRMGIASKKSIRSKQDNDSKPSNTKTKKQMVYNQPLVDVANIPSKINSFQTGTKLRNSIKMPSKNPSFILNNQDSLPLIKTLDSSIPKNVSSQNSRSLHQSKPFKNQNSLNYLSIAPNISNDTKITSRKNLFDKKEISNSLYVEPTGPFLKSPSRGIQSRNFRSIKPLSRQVSYDMNLNTNGNQTLDQIKIERIDPLRNISNNKKYTTESNEIEKQLFDLENDDQTGKYVIKINKVEDYREKEKEIVHKKKNSMIGHKSKTIYIHNITAPIPKGQRLYRQTIKDLSSYKEKQKQREMKESRENKQPKENTQKTRKERKNNTNTQSNIKEVNMTNFQKQMNSFYEKYQKMQNYDEYNEEIEEGIEKVKKYHKLVCTKQVCHHLRKFEDKMKKIKHQNSNKKPMKLAQLDIKHDYSI